MGLSILAASLPTVDFSTNEIHCGAASADATTARNTDGWYRCSCCCYCQYDTSAFALKSKCLSFASRSQHHAAASPACCFGLNRPTARRRGLVSSLTAGCTSCTMRELKHCSFHTVAFPLDCRGRMPLPMHCILVQDLRRQPTDGV